MKLQSSSGENSINFLDTDWEKLGQEVKAINDKYNAPKEQRLEKISKQTTGNMYAHKNQQSINFLENEVPRPDPVKAEHIQMFNVVKLSQSFDPENRLQTDKYISRTSSDNASDISNYGGPNKFMGSESAPSIWDCDKLQRMAAQLDNKSKTLQEKQDIQESRKSIRQQSIDNLAEALQNVDLRKESNISPAGDQNVSEDQARFNKSANNISIFDVINGENNFDHLPEKTTGEIVAENSRKRHIQKDTSWKANNKIVTSQGLVDRMFDILTNNKEE